MPKVKTHSGTSKRFKVTSSGKVKHKSAGMRHLLRKKTTKAKRALGNDGILIRREGVNMLNLLHLPTSSK